MSRDLYNSFTINIRIMGNLSSVPDASFESIDPGNKIQILPEKPSGIFLISFPNAFDFVFGCAGS